MLGRTLDYSELYSRENPVSEATLNAIEHLQTMDELDDKPTLEELRSALDAIVAGKDLDRMASLLRSSNEPREPFCMSCM